MATRGFAGIATELANKARTKALSLLSRTLEELGYKPE